LLHFAALAFSPTLLRRRSRWTCRSSNMTVDCNQQSLHASNLAGQQQLHVQKLCSQLLSHQLP
jgi:hypothetical protein